MTSTAINELNKLVLKKITSTYNKDIFKISNFKIEPEGEAYHACHFQLNNSYVIYRQAKITPKKTGQFVTFWKREKNSPIQPFNEEDSFDFFIVDVKTKNKLGQFIFPKSILIKKQLITSKTKEGKRGFRVYPPWDILHSKQAINTQKWQLNYFHDTKSTNNLKQVNLLFKNN